MAMMAGGVYEALIDAGATPAKALAAAEEVAANTRDQFDMRLEFAKIRGEFSTVKWMIGINTAILLGFFGTFLAFALNHLTLK